MRDYIELAKWFSHKAVMDSLARGENNLPGLHANTQIPKIAGAAKIYLLTGLNEEPLSDKNCETCCVYNMLKLTEYMYQCNLLTKMQ